MEGEGIGVGVDQEVAGPVEEGEGEQGRRVEHSYL